MFIVYENISKNGLYSSIIWNVLAVFSKMLFIMVTNLCWVFVVFYFPCQYMKYDLRPNTKGPILLNGCCSFKGGFFCCRRLFIWVRIYIYIYIYNNNKFIKIWRIQKWEHLTQYNCTEKKYVFAHICIHFIRFLFKESQVLCYKKFVKNSTDLLVS